MQRALLWLVIAGCNFDSAAKGGPEIGNPEAGSSGDEETTAAASEEVTGDASTGPGPIEGPAKRRLSLAALDGLGGAPVLVARQEAYADLSFLGPDMARLPHEAESPTRAWVRLPDPAPDHIWMTWDTGAPAPEDPAAVWDGFEAVWHFADAPTDSTGNGWDVDVGDAVYGEGVAGRGLVTGEEAHVLLEDGGPPLEDALTVEAWVRLDELDLGAARFIALKPDAYYIRAVEQTLAQPRAGVRLAGDGLHEVGPAFTLATTWTYVVLTYDGAAVRMFVDGEEVDADEVDTAAAIAQSDAALELGRRLPGNLDEIRISAVGRTPEWIAAQHASVTGTVIDYGPPEPL